MMYWYSSTQRNQVSGQSSPCHHHTAGTKRVRSKKVGGGKRNMARRNQRTGRNIHLPSFTRRREKPNIFRTVLSLQFSSGTGHQPPLLSANKSSQCKKSFGKKNTWGWLRDRIMAENRGLRPRTADKSMGKKFVPKMPPSSLAVRKNKKPRRGVKAQSWRQGQESRRNQEARRLGGSDASTLFGFQEAAFPTRQNIRRAAGRTRRKCWHLSPPKS